MPVDFSVIGSSKKDLKQLILKTLQDGRFLSARQIYLTISKELAEGYNVSYQGVHKMLIQLTDQGLLKKENSEYGLNPVWVHDLKAFGDFLEKSMSGKTKVEDVFNIHENFKVYVGRANTTRALLGVTSRAKRGDLLFGQAKTGTAYPTEFYSALEQASVRGVAIHTILPSSLETSHFANFLASLDPDNIKIRNSSTDYLRLFGIKDKEIIVAVTFPDAYLGIHFVDPAITKYFFKSFMDEWKNSPRRKMK
ncbi:hypothetical protein HUU53_00165 [Candidatus Micrarchaeota archaeon]|nr:hypothetical protein [Candidatus Micrarchaeota archaeon]